ncbi:cold shock domain-containing protein [Streptomyces sp. NPDC001941]|uniref:cold-shock protein n=1 Tax=Streptomyces sp. NPDC001941 TaxID=3154659 RepID=UPI0033273BCF
MHQRCEGLVRFFDRSRGVGYVVPFGRREIITVHRTDLAPGCRTLAEGQHVSFRLRLGQGRFEAFDVQP